MGIIRNALEKIHRRIITKRYQQYLKVADNIIDKRIEKRQLIFVSEPEIKNNPQKYRGQAARNNLPVFFEKEVLFNNDKDNFIHNIYYTLNGTNRSLGYTTTLAMTAIHSNCIVVLSDERRIREFKNAMTEIIYSKIMERDTLFMQFYNTMQNIFALEDITKDMKQIKKNINKL